MRTSIDASIINRPRMLAGMPWEYVVFVLGLFGYMALMFHNPLMIVPAFITLAFLRGAGRRDAMFMLVYKRHMHQASMYSPAPISSVALRQKRPEGYGRYDHN